MTTQTPANEPDPFRAIWEAWNSAVATSSDSDVPTVFDWNYLRGQKYLLRRSWPRLADALDALPEPVTPYVAAAPAELVSAVERFERAGYEVYPHSICKNCGHAWRDHGFLITSPNCFACERGAAWCSGFAR